MKAMVLEKGSQNLVLKELPMPEPLAQQVRIKVSCCGVCRTDLHIVDGDLTEAKEHLIPGHEVIGHVDAMGDQVSGLEVGQRVGVPWLANSCGHCGFCSSARENLCDDAQFTGYHVNGGYAEFMVADALACYPLPDGYSDEAMAPMMCAGLIGYRSWQMAGDCQQLGLYGFGAAAHIICQMAAQQGTAVYAFTRPADHAAQQLAMACGAVWAGDSDQPSPVQLDAAIIFAAVGALVPQALKQLRKGGRVVCAGIHMSDIPEFPYAYLWGERSICSVANLTRQDGLEFLQLAEQVSIKTAHQVYPLAAANEALALMRSGQLTGAAVLKVG